MEHEVVLAEMQALLASLKSTLSDEGSLASDAASEPPATTSADYQSPRNSSERLPDHRALRRFLLMV